MPPICFGSEQSGGVTVATLFPTPSPSLLSHLPTLSIVFSLASTRPHPQHHLFFCDWYKVGPILHLAGQIGLAPASMELVQGLEEQVCEMRNLYPILLRHLPFSTTPPLHTLTSHLTACILTCLLFPHLPPASRLLHVRRQMRRRTDSRSPLPSSSSPRHRRPYSSAGMAGATERSQRDASPRSPPTAVGAWHLLPVVGRRLRKGGRGSLRSRVPACLPSPPTLVG